MAGWRRVRRYLDWALLVTILVVIISGLGITEYRIIEHITFGMFTKAVAFRVHFALWKLLVALLAIHIVWWSPVLVRFRKREKK